MIDKEFKFLVRELAEFPLHEATVAKDLNVFEQRANRLIFDARFLDRMMKGLK